ncbi:MAG: acetylglutamate kinase [Desulfovibrionaceae bacterium]|nr:acetylglutamate kinase [Desulfovibrionaceae bacterium]
MEQLAVIKYGGHAMDQADLAAAFAKAILKLTQEHYPCIIVHGGGPQINSMLKNLHIESKFIDGLRVTDAATMQVVEMVLAGSVNKDVVARLAQAGVKAIGLSGRDAELLMCEPLDIKLGQVGKITQVNTQIIETLLKAHFTPVIAPLANGINFACYNINADLAAGAIAGALKAKYFVLISDVPGVLDGEGQVIKKLNRTKIQELRDKGIIKGGMLPKIDSCLNALEQGAEQALILDGRAPASLSRYLLTGEPLGTLVEA